MRAEAEIVDSDSSDEAWAKLCRYVAGVLPGRGARAPRGADRAIARASRCPPSTRPPTRAARSGCARRSSPSLRSVIEASAERRPLVLAFEDIHWADDGMLDAIEHLAQWVRAPLLLVCLARDELLERRDGLGRRAAQRDPALPRPPQPGRLAPPGGDPARAHGQRRRPGARRWPSAPAAIRCSPRRWCGASRRRRATAIAELPDTVQAVLAARLDALDPFERRLVQQASVVGRTFWEGSLAALAEQEGRDLGDALSGLQAKDILAPGAESRLAGERELAFKHVLIRDVAYGMLPKAVRCRKHFEVGRFIEERFGDRTDEVVALLAEHYGRSAALGAEGERRGPRAGRRSRSARCTSSRRPATPPRCSTPTPRRSPTTATRWSCWAPRTTPWPPGSARSRATSRCAWGAWTPRSRCGASAWTITAARRTSTAWPTCTASWAPPWRSRASARPRSRTTSAGSTCSRTARRGWSWCASTRRRPGCTSRPATTCSPSTPPRRRCAWRSAWARPAPPAARTASSGGCSGASETPRRRARTSSARWSSRAALQDDSEAEPRGDHSETILALLALGRHLEISEADARGAGEAYDEALALAVQVGDLPSQVELHSAVAQLAAYRADWEQVRRSTDASADLAEREGLVSKLCLPYALRGLLRWREGSLDRAEERFRRAHELAEQVGWSELSFQALYGLALTLRDRGEHIDAVTALGQAIDVCERAGPGRPVRAGHGHPGGGAGAGRPLARRAGVGRRGRGPGRAPALPDRQGGGAGGPRRQRRGPRHRAQTCWSRPRTPGPSWSARWKQRAAACWPASGSGTPTRHARRSCSQSSAEECERLGVAHLAEKARAAGTGLSPDV